MSTHDSGEDDSTPAVIGALARRLGVAEACLARDLAALGVTLAPDVTEEGAMSEIGRVAWAMSSWSFQTDPDERARTTGVLPDAARNAGPDVNPTEPASCSSDQSMFPHRKEDTMSTHLILIETGYKTASSNYSFATLGPMTLDEARTRFDALRSGSDRALPADDGATTLNVTDTQFVRLRPGRTGTSLDRVTLGQIT